MTIRRSRERTVAAVAASGPQAESSRILVLEIAQPLRRDERDDADDGVTYGEDTPKHADRLGVADVIRRVHMGGLDVLYLGAHSVRSSTRLAELSPVNDVSSSREERVLPREVVRP